MRWRRRYWNFRRGAFQPGLDWKRTFSIEKLRVQSEAMLDFQRRCLPRRRRLTNLATACFLLSLQRAARRLGGRESRDVEQTLRLYAADLKRAIRE